MSAEPIVEATWLDLLRAEVAKEGKTVTSVAAEIGMPRPSLSLLLNDNYPAAVAKKAAKFESKVLSLFTDQLVCPHLGKAIGRDTCRTFAARPMTTSSPVKVKQFMACRDCPKNPIQNADTGTTPEGKTNV